MLSKITITLEQVPCMQNLNRKDLKEIRRLLSRVSASQVTDDVLKGIQKAIVVDLGVVPELNRAIILRVTELLAERNRFLYGKSR